MARTKLQTFETFASAFGGEDRVQTVGKLGVSFWVAAPGLAGGCCPARSDAIVNTSVFAIPQENRRVSSAHTVYTSTARRPRTTTISRAPGIGRHFDRRGGRLDSSWGAGSGVRAQLSSDRRRRVGQGKRNWGNVCAMMRPWLSLRRGYEAGLQAPATPTEEASESSRLAMFAHFLLSHSRLSPRPSLALPMRARLVDPRRAQEDAKIVR